MIVSHLCIVMKSCCHYNIVLLFFSSEKCSDQVPAECSDVVPYTTYPNSLFGLNGTAEYTDFSDRIESALRNCTNVDPFWTRWGVCNIMFPRCLLGYELQLCRETCLGEFSSLGSGQTAKTMLECVQSVIKASVLKNHTTLSSIDVIGFSD